MTHKTLSCRQLSFLKMSPELHLDLTGTFLECCPGLKAKKVSSSVQNELRVGSLPLNYSGTLCMGPDEFSERWISFPLMNRECHTIEHSNVSNLSNQSSLIDHITSHDAITSFAIQCIPLN